METENSKIPNKIVTHSIAELVLYIDFVHCRIIFVYNKYFSNDTFVILYDMQRVPPIEKHLLHTFLIMRIFTCLCVFYIIFVKKSIPLGP